MSMNKKFGVEVELESDEWLDYDDIYSCINNCNEVKDDGSLNYGCECTSIPLNRIKDIFNFIHESRNAMMEYGCYTQSPCAIHIHISNHKKPINLHKICYSFYDVFEKIRNNNKSGLMHYRNESISNADLKSRLINKKLIMQNNEDFYKFCNQSSNILQHYRPTTLRTRMGYNNATLEFRPIPNNRTSKKYFNVWEKIYKTMIEKSEKMHLNEMEKITDSINRFDSLSHKFLAFKEFFDLSFKELHVLMYNQNDKTKNMYDDIISKNKYDFLNIMHELIFSNMDSNMEYDD